MAPLRRTILLRVTLLVAGTALAVGLGFIGFGLLPMVERIAQSQFNVAAARIEASLDSMFAPANDLLDMSRGWTNGEAPSLDDPAAFNRIFMPVIKSLPQVTSVVAGTTTGQGWLLLQQAGGRWRNRMTDVPRNGRKHLFFEHLPNGQVTSEWRDVDYDPRRRPWYLAAMNGTAGTLTHWTAPYLFFTTGDVGVTASTRIRLKDGRDFVLGFDLMLRDLSKATMQSAVGKQGMVLVLTDDNRVLALPVAPSLAPPDWLKKVLRPVDELGLAPVSDALAAWLATQRASGSVLAYRSGGEPWLASMRPYLLGEQKLWVMTLAPAADFAPAWGTLSTVLATLLALVLLLAFLIVRAYARRIALPLEQLAAASERIGQLDFTPTPPIRSPVTEIMQLATAQDGMRQLLQRNQQELSDQAGTLSDQITALRAAEGRLRESEAYNKVLFVDSRIPLVVMEPNGGRFVDCNQAAVDIYRVASRDAVLGMTVADVSAPTQESGVSSVELAQQHVQRALRDGAVMFEWRHQRADGSIWDAEVHLMRFRYAGRTLLQFSLQDITERKVAAGEIAQLAFYDTLTGLPNRRLLSDRLQLALGTSACTGRKGSLLFIDLDNFKQLNDTFGHDQGDLLLKQVAGRLVDCVREIDTVGRFGGDEFLVMLLDLAEDPLEAARHTEAVGYKILDRLNQPYDLSGREHYSSPSIGITLFADPGDTVDELLKRADMAMYQAKAAGRNVLRFFDPDIQARVTARVALESDLRQSVARGELMLHYQVQVDLSGTPIGAEALVRWNHPQRGLVLPNDFIPLAEETGLILPVGQWVLECACRQLVDWSARPDRAHWSLAVNVSSRQFRHPQFVDQVLDVIARTGADPQRLKLELTESVLVDDVETTISKMTQLRDSGLTFSLDDFGTGFSSLSYLKRLPLDQLKIDQSFVRDVLTDPNDAAIARAIVNLAQSLGLTVIAEGVETTAQRDFLASEGCQAYQGYLFGRPGPVHLLSLPGAIPNAETAPPAG